MDCLNDPVFKIYYVVRGDDETFKNGTVEIICSSKKKAEKYCNEHYMLVQNGLWMSREQDSLQYYEIENCNVY